MEPLAARDPGNTQWQRDLSISHNKLGDVLVAQGNLPGAPEAYRKDLAIMEPPGRARSGQHTVAARPVAPAQYLSVLVAVLVAQGNLPGALEAYRKGLAIMEPLAARDPGNTQWQRDLSISHNKLGDVLVAQGNLPGALEAYRKDLAIMEPLAARDPGNTQWQRDLPISLGRVADVLTRQRKFSEAGPVAERALTQVRAATARFPDDPRIARDLPYYEALVRSAGGTP